jgi:diguanylate cyclase (GGDEF)-like protein
VAIVCIVVAVLNSAQRTNRAAAEHERQLFSRALTTHGEMLLNELENAARPETGFAVADAEQDRIAVQVLEQRITRLRASPDFDFVAVLAGAKARTDIVRPELAPLLDFVRGGRGGLPGAIRADSAADPKGAPFRVAAAVHSFRGRPAIVGAVAFEAAGEPRLIVSARFIDRGLLAAIAEKLQLKNLHFAEEDLARGEETIPLADLNGIVMARVSWTPSQPGAEIVDNVLPFFWVALAGFALLAAFVLRYMRRTAAAIAAGESRLRHLAMHDPLCGLPNRIYFSERLEAAIDDVQHGGVPAAVFYIDLDHFKEVNDTLGHPAGDELIRNVTLRLSRALDGNDLVARLGGDEFAVISTIGTNPQKMTALAQRIIAALCEPYTINKQNIVIGASIGIAVIDKASGNSADIMRYADMALYRAKNEGRNRACLYDSAMDADLSSRKLLELDLRRAIETNELKLLYQPLVNASGEVVFGVEALCRWDHPVRGAIPPSEFIPIAEHSGLIIELGEWVLRRACTDGKAWPKLTLAVNVSPLQFRRSDFCDVVERILAETQFDPARLELELTESTLIGNVDIAEAAMLRLKALGIRLALDDFGTGYSSLLYLRRFPFDKLKIDRSFVLSIEKAADAAAIVHAIVSLGRGLGMKVTAEGVETADQQLFLRAAGVHSMQGYRFGRAVSAAEITSRLQSQVSGRGLGTPAALAG